MDINLHIRRYLPADQKDIISLNELGLKQVGIFVKSIWKKDLSEIEEVYLKDGEFLVGEYQGKMVAMGGLKNEDKGVAEIKRMRVHPDYQGKGFGQMILAALEQRAKEMGFKKLTLTTTIKQPIAQRLYLKNNYKELKRGKIGVLNEQNVYSEIENIYYEKDL